MSDEQPTPGETVNMKVRYNGNNCAYLDTAHGDGVYSGTNKYSDEPVTLRWDGEQWTEVS